MRPPLNKILSLPWRQANPVYLSAWRETAYAQPIGNGERGGPGHGPVKSPLSGWLGGKYQLSRQIVPLIPTHECYVEPFAGAAWVLFRKPLSAVEVLNDSNREIVTLYRVVQYHLEEFVRYFKWVLVSREEFQRWPWPADTLTDIQRAARFYYLQKLSFGGRMDDSPAFATATTRPPRLNLLCIEEDLSAVHLRLAQVFVENLPYQQVIERYDRPTTFFYLDPPYGDAEDYYGEGLFSKEDFHRLAALLQGIQGRFLMSLNDAPEVREIFREFVMEEVACRYTCSRTSRPEVRELLIRNY